MGLSRTVSEIDGDFGQKSQNFPTPCILRPHSRGSPWNWIPALGVKKLEWWAVGPTKKFNDIFSRIDTMHQRDRRIDGQTPGDSRDRAYAQRRAVKTAISFSNTLPWARIPFSSLYG